jgi:hypothetical protein
MGVEFRNTIIIEGSPEEIQTVLDFMKSERRPVLDLCKVLSVPEALIFEDDSISDRMHHFVKWIRGQTETCEGNKGKGKNIYDSDNGVDYFEHCDLFPYPFVFTAIQWKIIRKMLHNLEEFGFATSQEWIFEKYWLGTDGKEAVKEDGQENVISIWTRRMDLDCVFGILRKRFPTVLFTFKLLGDVTDVESSIQVRGGEVWSKTTSSLGYEPLRYDYRDSEESPPQLIMPSETQATEDVTVI